MNEEILVKWRDLIEYGKRYWVDSVPTGISDDEFDRLEEQAYREDGFYVRDYVLSTYLKGTKTKNRDIEKIKKFKVGEGRTMLEAMKESANELGIPYDKLYCDLKYDGSSIAIYIDPLTGTTQRLVTVGNLNIDNFGVDQTWKLINHVPKKWPLGIRTVQCEALVDTVRLSGTDPEKARQKANGLINSKDMEGEVNNLLTLRAYRYYSDQPLGKNYKEVLESFPTIKSKVDGHVMFSPAQVWTLEELIDIGGSYTETDLTLTRDGKFLNDGWVLYNQDGICQRALKFAGAGSGEIIKSTVLDIQWNDQSSKGKDSWSANVIINPIVIKGSTIRKPSAGSVSKLIKNNISQGAEIGIILANSTIPMVGKVVKPGNGMFNWPTCSCGYTMGPSDTYGSLLKCGNPMCSERLARMRRAVKGGVDFNTLLVIDRFKWENTDLDMNLVHSLVKDNKEEEYYKYLVSFLKTDLQKRNLDLVWKASWVVLRELI